MKKLMIFIAMIALLTSCCDCYAPKMKSPVIYQGIDSGYTTRVHRLYYIVVLKDSDNVVYNIPIEHGYFNEFGDSIYKNCKLGDTIK